MFVLSLNASEWDRRNIGNALGDFSVCQCFHYSFPLWISTHLPFLLSLYILFHYVSILFSPSLPLRSLPIFFFIQATRGWGGIHTSSKPIKQRVQWRPLLPPLTDGNNHTKISPKQPPLSVPRGLFFFCLVTWPLITTAMDIDVSSQVYGAWQKWKFAWHLGSSASEGRAGCDKRTGEAVFKRTKRKSGEEKSYLATN